jgi:hypothetical protein
MAHHNADAKAILKEARNMGWRLDKVTGDGHYRMVHETPDTPIAILPSCYTHPRARHNALAILRRLVAGRTSSEKRTMTA